MCIFITVFLKLIILKVLIKIKLLLHLSFIYSKQLMKPKIIFALLPIDKPYICCCCLVAQSCLTLCHPMDCSHASLAFTISQSLLKLMSTESVMPFNHLVLCCLLRLPPSILPSIKVFNESTFHIKSRKYQSSASASLLPMNIQDFFPLGRTGCISLQSRRLSRVFSSTTN